MENSARVATTPFVTPFNPHAPFSIIIMDLEEFKLGHRKTVVEASTVGLRPGQWPDVVLLWGPNLVLGPLTFVERRPVFDPTGEELVAMVYRGKFSERELNILND